MIVYPGFTLVETFQELDEFMVEFIGGGRSIDRVLLGGRHLMTSREARSIEIGRNGGSDLRTEGVGSRDRGLNGDESWGRDCSER